MNERLVWIDCEMTGLSLETDALVEVAALVTDFDLNVLGEGIDVLIKPPQAALDQMIDFVRNMHVSSGLLEELDGGTTMEDAEQQVLAYIKEHCPDGSRPPLGGNTVATDRSFLARDMPELEGFLHYRNVDVSSIKELARRWYPAHLLRGPGQARQPPCAGRHPGEHRGAALLPRGRLRAAARPRHDRRSRDRGEARRHDHRARPRFRIRALIALHFSSVLRLRVRSHGGYSSAGRAPPCGGGCRGFKSRYSPQVRRAPVPRGPSSFPTVTGRGCARNCRVGSPRRP